MSPPRLALGMALAAALVTPPALARPVTVGLAAINDFHGHLEPPGQSAAVPDGKGGALSVPAGGAARLATAIRQIRARYRHHLTVAAGDLIGASPLASALFLDEPAVEALNRIGLDFNAAGNHEFDHGVPELLRKQAGGCARHTERQPCRLERFRGARFRFLAANTVAANGQPLFPGTALRRFGQGRNAVTVGLIGLTLRTTADLVPAAVGRTVTFRDEAETANALVADLKRKGADAVVILIHEGGRIAGPPDPDGCTGLAGAIRPILDRLDSRVDLVISGHTHQAYVCDYGTLNPAKPFLLTSGGTWGQYVTDIALDIDPAGKRVVARRAHNRVVRADSPPRHGITAPPDAAPPVAPAPDIAAYVARYTKAAQREAKRKIGWLAEPLDKQDHRLGNLIADAQLAATGPAGAQIACTNPFGIRQALRAGPDGVVTFGALYDVQPFNSPLVTMTLTGAGLYEAMEQQLDGNGPEQVLACSAGFQQTVDRGRKAGQRIVALRLNGSPIDRTASYRITVNAFLADGGDNFRAFTQGQGRTTGMTDIAALEAWLKPDSPKRRPAPELRVLDSNGPQPLPTAHP